MVEPQIVVLDVAGSSPVGHPTPFSDLRRPALRRQLGHGKDAIEAGDDAVFAEDFEKVIEAGPNSFASAGQAHGMYE